MWSSYMIPSPPKIMGLVSTWHCLCCTVEYPSRNEKGYLEIRNLGDKTEWCMYTWETVAMV